MQGRVLSVLSVLVLMLGIVIVFAMNGPASARLVSIEPLPDIGAMCEVETPAYAASQESINTQQVGRAPTRYVRDTDPTYGAVAVDTRLNEVFLQDHNLWSIRVFNRQDNTPASAERTEPKRVIAGSNTQLQFNSCVYVDPKNGEIFSIENDIGDRMVVFSHDAQGK